jgi:glutamate-1-semialdehyde 2,1-aminomutase/spore coat polysaccharide biosynthesis protein SpsF
MGTGQSSPAKDKNTDPDSKSKTQDQSKEQAQVKTVAICLARMGSTRLPGKVLKDLGGKPLLRWTLDAAHSVSLIDKVVLATTVKAEDDAIAAYCEHNLIECFRGSEDDVLDRFYQCARQYEADIVLRFTCDCPFLDPHVIAEVIQLRRLTGADFASNCYPPTWPDGLDTDCFTFAALERAWQDTTSAIDRGCVVPYITRNRDLFKVVNLTCPLPGGENEHWVCDTAEDFRFCEEIAKRINPRKPPSYTDIWDILTREPELRQINKASIRNERFYADIAAERLPARTFAASQRVFERAAKVIPTGANTFSKSHLQLPAGRSPLYVTHGEGAYLFDVDGNRYVDLVGALHPVVLGYCDPDVDRAVRQQLDCGVTLSLTSPLEAQLAETLVRLIPCAEMVKFGKSGTDVTTAAVRLARAHTGRDHVLVAGYHGWADWSMSCTDRADGIPEDVRYLTHRMNFGIEYTEPDGVPPKEYAAVVIEPTDSPEYLTWLREFCTKHGIVLIFDEIRTGFRYALGGAQELFGVTPDLACFGKAMANGMPLSALVGKRDIMKRMETPDVFYSGTFFGETLSLAAAIATIKKLEEKNVIHHLWNKGNVLVFAIKGHINRWQLNEVVTLDGLSCDGRIAFHGPHKDKVRSLFMESMIQQGVFIINSNTLSYAMGDPELKRIIDAYAHTLEKISQALKDGSIEHVWPTQAAPLRMSA